MVDTLSARSWRTFEEYAIGNVLPTIQSSSAKHKRTDIVFCVHGSNGVKTEVKTCVRSRVSIRCKIPSNWRIFLRNSERVITMIIFIKRLEATQSGLSLHFYFGSFICP